MKLDAPRRVHDRRKCGRIITSWCPAEVLRNPVRPEQIQIQNFIDGQFVPPIGGKYLENIEPATGKPYSLVPDSDSRDVEAAVAAAERAFPAWSRTSAAERSRLLLRIAELIERDLEKFARAESVDTGKPLSLARSLDIPRASSNFRFFATAILHTENRGARHGWRRFQLHAAPAARCRWTNFALESAALFVELENRARDCGRKHCGRETERTDADDRFLARRNLSRSGLPNGVLNIVHGTGPNVGSAITAHPKIGTISFTGGTVTGRKVAEAGAPLFKKVSLELGGKNPNIIFADADLDAAIAGSVRSSFANQGQVCLCGSRVFVERPAYDEFVRRFMEKASQLRSGGSAGCRTPTRARSSRRPSSRK